MDFKKIPLILSDIIKSMDLNINLLIFKGHSASLSGQIKSMDFNKIPLILSDLIKSIDFY